MKTVRARGRLRRRSTPVSTLPLRPELQALADRIGHCFADDELLERALTHRSWFEEDPSAKSNERSEFLGDAVLGLWPSPTSCRSYPDLPEGKLSKVRAFVVSATTLADAAAELDLGPALLLGKGEDRSGGREKPRSWPTPSRPSSVPCTWTAAGRRPSPDPPAARRSHRGGIGRTRRSGLQDPPGELPASSSSSPGMTSSTRVPTTPSGSSPRCVDGMSRGRGEGRSKKQASRQARDAREHLAADVPADPQTTPGRGNGLRPRQQRRPERSRA